MRLFLEGPGDSVGTEYQILDGPFSKNVKTIKQKNKAQRANET